MFCFQVALLCSDMLHVCYKPSPSIYHMHESSFHPFSLCMRPLTFDPIPVISPIQAVPPQSGVDDYGNPWDDYPLTSDPEPAPRDEGLEVEVRTPGVNPLDNYDHPRSASIIATSRPVCSLIAVLPLSPPPPLLHRFSSHLCFT